LAALPERQSLALHSPEKEVEAALNLLENIRQLAADPGSRQQVQLLAQKLGLRIGLRFAVTRRQGGRGLSP
jgi:hypothetical protein